MKPGPQDEKTMQEALRNSEVRYRRLFEAAQDGILILDASTGQITDANPFLLDMLGYARGEILGKQLWEIGFFRDRALSEAAFRELQQEGYIRYEDLPLETKDGRRHDVEFVSNLYEVDHQKVIQCNIRDITDRKLLEAKWQQAQKMEVVGQLAGGVAHDFNNILTSTLLQLSMLLDDPSLPEGTKRALSQLEDEAKRAAGLTRQLLLFSRLQRHRPEAPETERRAGEPAQHAAAVAEQGYQFGISGGRRSPVDRGGFWNDRAGGDEPVFERAGRDGAAGRTPDD